MYQFSIKLTDINTDPCGIANIEVSDGFYGKALSEMDGACIQFIRDRLIRHMQRIVLYTVSMPVSDREAYARALQNARAIGVEAVKICACALGDCSEEIIAQAAELVRIGEAVGVKLAFEPRAKYPALTLDVYKKLRSKGTCLIFNPMEFVKQDKNPFLTVLYKYKHKEDILFLRVNDCLYGGGPVMVEQGNSEIKECASNLLARSFHGYFSFTPYLTDTPTRQVVDAFLYTLTQM